MLSRVVPGMSVAITRSSPISRLTSVDLPTLGRPIIAMRMESSSGVAASVSGSRPASTISINDSQPMPCTAAMACGSPQPRRWNSAPTTPGSRPSALLTARNSGLPARSSRRATYWSSVVSPARPSTTRMTRSASDTARSVCSRIRVSTPALGVAITPPVSTTMQGTGPTRPYPYWRSRVTPGTSATMASRVLVSVLKSVDLPTLGRPTRATIGSMGLRRGSGCAGAACSGGFSLAPLDTARQAEILPLSSLMMTVSPLTMGAALTRSPAGMHARRQRAGVDVEEMQVAIEVGHHHKRCRPRPAATGGDGSGLPASTAQRRCGGRS